MSIGNISVGYSSRRQQIAFLLLLVDTKHFCWIFFKTTTYCVSFSTCRYETCLLDILQDDNILCLIFYLSIRNMSVGYSSRQQQIVFLLLLVDTKHFCWDTLQDNNILCFYFYLSIQNISVGYFSRWQQIVFLLLLVDTKHFCWIFFKMTTDCVSSSTCWYKTFLLGYSSRRQQIVFLLLLVDRKHFCWDILQDDNRLCFYFYLLIGNISVGYSSRWQQIVFLLLHVDRKHFCWIFFKTTTDCVSTSTCWYKTFLLDILQDDNILCFIFYLSIRNMSVGYSSRRQHIVSHFLLVDTKHVCWIFFKTTTDCVSTSTSRYKTFLLDILQDNNILCFIFYLSIQNMSVGYSSRQQHIVFHFLLVDTKHVCWIFFKTTTHCVSFSTCR